MKERLLRIFELLLQHLGKRNWWPGETALEIMIGAILTQNTSWKNVERAIENLKAKGLISIEKLYDIKTEELAKIIKAAGFYNVKAKRLKNFVEVIWKKFHGKIEDMMRVEGKILRNELLQIKGIGPETADSILLYALNKPFFVVDAYTKRFVLNHRLFNGRLDYDSLQKFFMENLPKDLYIYNEFHALIVALCQRYCKKRPLCSACPLKEEKEVDHDLSCNRR